MFATLKDRAWRLLSGIRNWCGRAWASIRPGPEAVRGAMWALLAAAAAAAFTAGSYVRLGWGAWIDYPFAFVAAALIVLLGALVVALLLTLFRKLPRRATSFIVGSGAVIVLLFGPPQLGLPMGTAVALVEGVLGAAIATLLCGDIRAASLAKKIVTVCVLVLALAANALLFFFFRSDGETPQLTQFQPAGRAPAELDVENPANPGSYSVKVLFYGSGTDIRRPEYGSQVALKTPTVDGSKFFKDFKGWRRSLRRHYWGFDADKLPLNARVWYPDGAGPFPLVLIVHGNHGMTDFSDPGYEYLGRLMASRGFIFASIDENFLNSGLFHDPPKQQPVRGWMLLEHLRLWRDWNRKAGNLFNGKVDFERIALMGHSRGGEAAATAALFNRLSYYPDDATVRFDYGFPIKAVVAIAPADGQYKPAGQWRSLQDVSYFVIQGGWDADVSSFVGSRQFDRVSFTKPGPWLKSELWIYRANHGQFNTSWGRFDTGYGPLSWFLNVKPLLSGEDQRRVAKIYISAFLEATLHDRREYVAVFRDYRCIREWLPDTVYVGRYEDATDRSIAGFNEDPDVTTTTMPGGRIRAQGFTLWREGRIPFRDGDRGYNGVFLGWKRKKGSAAPIYEVTLPESGLALNDRAVLRISVAAVDEDPPDPDQKANEEKKDKDQPKKDRDAPDFSVELQSADGAVASQSMTRFDSIPPPMNVRFTKLEQMDSSAYKKATEPVFQTIAIPVSAFPAVAPAKLHVIRFRFDRTPASVIIISGIGISGN
jgi:dienelactone hydrolase